MCVRATEYMSNYSCVEVVVFYFIAEFLSASHTRETSTATTYTDRKTLMMDHLVFSSR